MMLSETWETFAQLSRRLPEKDTSSCVKKRQVLLDRFLLQFLKESHRDENCILSDMRNVPNELSHEFMRNIFNVTSSTAEADDILNLENYLLEGRGWMLLYTIHKIGVKVQNCAEAINLSTVLQLSTDIATVSRGVYNRQDLCNILLTLLPFCLKIRQSESNGNLPKSIGADPPVAVSRCFQWVDHMPRQSKYVGYDFTGRRDLKKTIPPRIKKHYTKTMSSKERPAPPAESDADDDSDSKTGIKQPRLRKSMRTQVWTPLAKEEESASEDDFVDDSDVMDMRSKAIGSSHLFQLLVLLLEDLAVLDVSLENPGQALSPLILPTLLDVLLTFSSAAATHPDPTTPTPTPTSSSSAQSDLDAVLLPWAREQGLVLQQLLVRVILTLAGLVATQQNGVRILLSLKVVPGILSSLAYCQREENGATGERTVLERNVIRDAVCGCLDLFCVMYNHLPFNPSFVRDANAVMELFRRHGGEDYFQYLFALSDQQNTNKSQAVDESHVDPIKWLCNLMHCLKVVKVNYIHAIKCLKRRHRNCEYGFFFHHHHDIFGAPLESVVPVNEDNSTVQGKLADPSLCQIAKLSCLLLECLRKSRSKRTKLLILCALRQEGVCCCVHPASVVNSIVALLPHLTLAVGHYALETLSTVLLEQFHGSGEAQATTTALSCSQCCPQRQLTSDSAFRVDSGFASCEVGETRDQRSVSRWRSLRLLCHHVLSGDESIALAVAKHLVTLAMRGNSDVKEELFFGIYLHVLNMRAVEQHVANASQGEKEDLTSSGEENGWVSSVPNSVMLFCVSSLPYVLQVDKVMHLFLEKGGLACLTQLLDNDQLRMPVMGVFEALIMIDEQALTVRQAPPPAFTTQQSVEYKGGIVIQTFIDTLAQKTCAITTSFQQLQLKGSQTKKADSETVKQGDDDETKGLKAPFRRMESNHEANAVDHINQSILETLPALQDMWKTCAKLCMNSETFRACYRSSPCLYIVQETLVLAMGILVDMSDRDGEEPTGDKEPHEGSPRQPSSLAFHFARLAFIEAVMVVCFSCQTILPLQKEGKEEPMWLRVRSTLEQCVELEPSKLRAIFDMLLNAAQPQLPSVLEYSFDQITSTLSRQDVDDVEDEDEVMKFAHHWSDDEFETLFTEQGYEADTETNLLDDWQKKMEGRLSGPGVKPTQVQCFPAVLRLFVELLVASQHTASGRSVLGPALLRLLHMLRGSHATTRAACKQGLLELILKGFQHVLLQPSEQQQHPVLYEILLTTIQVLGQVEISSSELALLFGFFLQTKDVDPLLSTLTGIVENSWVAPSTYLGFPAKASGVHSPHIEKLSKDLSSTAGVWSLSAIQCAVRDLQWPPFESGFSLALWFSLDQLSSVHSPQEFHTDGSHEMENSSFVPAVGDCVHLVSLGDSTKMFEVWLHAASTTLLFRLTSLKCSSMVLREASVGLSVSRLDWHHLVFSYLDTLDGSTSLGKLSVRLDGRLAKEVVMDHPASMWHCPVSTATPSLHLGYTARLNERHRLGHYSLGPVLLFSDSSLSPEWWFHLFALGPTFGGLGKCDCGFPQVSYNGALHRDLLRDSSLNHDVLAGTAPLPDGEKALMSQCLHFEPGSWRTYCSFGVPVPAGGPSLLGLVPGASSGTALLGQCPRVVAASVSGHMNLSAHHNLPHALEQLGGVQALLFLVAKVVEESGEDKGDVKGLQVQSKAVHLLLTTLQRFPPLTAQFTHMQGYEMLAVVLRSSRAHVSFSLIKVLFDAATSESVFKVEAISGRLLLRTSSESIICNVAIITRLLLCWHVWQPAQPSLLELILEALVLLVRTDHPHHPFNIRQLQAAGVVKLLFNMYLERIQEDMPALSSQCGQHVASIVASVVGQPPDLALLASVTDFLLQLHPPTTRFINYASSAFYLHHVWLSDEEAHISAVKGMVKKGGHGKGDKAKQPALSHQTSDQDGEMERVQFHRQRGDSSEAWLDSVSQEGSPLTEDRLVVDQTARTPSSPAYPLLEATPDIPTRSFCLEESSGSSADSKTSLSDSEPKGSRLKQRKPFGQSDPPRGQEWSLRDKIKRRENSRIKSLTDSSDQNSRHGKGDASNGRVGKKEQCETRPEEADWSLEDSVDGKEPRIAVLTEGAAGVNKRQQLMASAAALGSQDSLGTQDEMQASLSSGGLEPTAARAQPDQDTSHSSSPLPSDHEEGLETLCLCVLQYMHKVLMEQPQHSMDDVFCQVINPRALLVLAQSSSARIRVVVTQVVSAYLWRAPYENQDEFLKEDGLFLLANQLSAFPVGRLQVETAFSLMLQHSFSFHHHYMVGELDLVSELQQVAPVLILSSLSRILPDVALCHNTLLVLSQVVENTPLMSSVLIDLGLPDALCNLLFTVQCSCSNAPDLDGMDSVQLILLDVQKIFCLLAVAQFSWTGMHHYQQMEYLFTLLQAMEDKERTRGEGGVKRAETARALQFAMVVSVVDYTQQLSKDMSKTAGSWLSSQSAGSLAPSAVRGNPSRALSSGLLNNSHHSPSPSPSPSLHLASSQAGAWGGLAPVGVGAGKAAGLRLLHSPTPHTTSFLGLSQEGGGSDPDLDQPPLFQDAPGSMGHRRPGSPSSPSSPAAGPEEGKQSLLQRLFGRKKKLEYSRIVQSELLERFKKFLPMAVDLAIFQDREEKVKSQTQHTLSFLSEPTTASLDDRFLKHMFTTVYQALALSLTKDPFYKRTRNTIMLSAKDILRSQFGRLLACMVSPRMEFEQRIFTVSYLMGESVGHDVVRLVAGMQHVCTELGVHIFNLMSVWRDWLNPNQRDLALTLLTVLRQCGCSLGSPDRPVLPEQAEALRDDKRAVKIRLIREQQTWLAKRVSFSERVATRFEGLVQRVQGHAMALTQQIAAQQGRERLSLVEHIKHAMAQQVQLKKNWQDIVTSLTHERGVWYHAESYPRSWELDPTEGPGRIRRRLMRCHVGLGSKFVRPAFQQNLVCQSKAPPLKYMFEDDHQVADSATLVYKLFTNDTVHNTFGCTAVAPATESRGELLLGEQYVYFVADKAIADTDYTQMLLGNRDQLSLMWRYSELMEVHCRWYQLQDNALEMFLVTGRTHLLAFTSTADRDRVVSLLLTQLDGPRGAEQTAVQVQRRWLDGAITNFDYLTLLNKLAGRSFNDLMQYPVFPFVLRDYHSDELDLENSGSFRDLRKPIAVQDKSRERKYMDNYEFLRQEEQKPGPEEVMRVAPFHYGSHYSNSGTVLHYLVRLPPFTRMFVSYQDNSFDIPDRTFHSIRTSWNLSSFQSSTDVKELIPEFFFLPEFFTNSEGFDFGHRQNGEIVDDVVLPAWSKADPRLFVLIQRQALESAVVTRMLHHWLDLVVGFKQTGDEAVKAINVFHPSTYFGMDVSSVHDPVKRQALLTMIRTYGQTPRQLFVSPHPPADPDTTLTASQHHEKRTYIPRPVSTVNGLRWGVYAGSLDLPPPVWQPVTQLPVAIANMVPLLTGPVFGIQENSALVMLHTKPAGTWYKQTEVLWAGAVTWDHPDGILRVFTHNSKPLINLMPPNPYHKVTCCAAALDRCLLFVAGESGNISVFNITHNVAKPSTLHVWGLRRMLCGHSGAVTTLQVCKDFGIVVSASRDASAIIWDLNRLSYVRTVARHKAALAAVAVSSTLGDVATVSHTGGGSELQVHTINGGQVGGYRCESLITCLAYSSAPEGRSINVIAGGLSTGVVRLWSSWDVSHLRDLIEDSGVPRPIVSLAYTVNSQALFVSLSDGTVLMWTTDRSSAPANAALFMPVLPHLS